MAALVILLKFWQPETIWSFEHEDKAERASEHANRRVYSTGRKLKAWMPWMLLSVFVFVWGLTPVKTFLNGGPKTSPNFLNGISSISIPVPVLDKAVTRTPPVVAKAAT
jgi:lactate permease